MKPGTAPRRVHVGRGLAVAAVGDHERRRVDTLGAAAGRVQGGGDHGARRALAARDEGVARAGRKVGEGGHRVRDLAVLAGLRVGLRDEPPLGGAPGDEGVGEVSVTLEERGPGLPGGIDVAGDGATRTVEQQIGDAAEGRDDDDQRAPVRADERHGVAHRVGVGERRPAELPDLEPLSSHVVRLIGCMPRARPRRRAA
jgi:hypothetical protein